MASLPLGRRIRRAVTRGAALAPVTACVVSGTLQVAPAAAAISNPPANGHGILVFPVRDFITADGYGRGQVVTVNVVRNGAVIGSSVAQAGADGIVLVNHPPNPGDLQNCWGQTTPGGATTAATPVPDIMAGDTIEVLTGLGNGDAVLTQNVVVTQPATDVGGDIVVRGTATAADGVSPLPAASVQQRMIGGAKALFDVNNRRDLRAPGDGTLLYPDAAGPTHWTATYAGLTAADRAKAVAAESRALWLGANPLAVNDVTLFEFGQIPGPTAGCQGTLAQTALTAVDRMTINAANVTAPLVASGVAAAGITGVTVAVPGRPAVAATIGAGTWTASIPPADLAALNQGSFTVTATFTGAGAPPAQSMTLSKDTVAPGPPSATPSPGTYQLAQSVSLRDGDASAQIRWTNDGSSPTATSTLYAGAISVTASQTLRAVAIDPAGNASPSASFAYVIQAPPPPAGNQSPPSAPVPPRPSDDRPSAPSPTSAVAGIKESSLAQPTLASLAADHKVSRAALRSGGLRMSMQLRDARVVRIAVYRVVNGRRAGSPLLVTFRVPQRSGTFAARLKSRSLLRALRPGSYELAVTPGASRTELGSTTRLRFRIVR